MAVYKVWVLLECEYDDIEADSPEEAAEMAKKAYKEILDKRFGWADIDTINTDIITEG